MSTQQVSKATLAQRARREREKMTKLAQHGCNSAQSKMAVVEILQRKNIGIIIREDRDSNAVCICRDNAKEKTTAKGKEKTNSMSAHNENVEFRLHDSNSRVDARETIVCILSLCR
ncbi:hypothetical protein Dimus_038451 [Dionaea muscipula]